MFFKKTIAFFLFFTPTLHSLKAQESIPENTIKGFQFVPAFNIDHCFIRDYLLGFGLGVAERKYEASARLNFDFRPYFKKISYQISETEVHQYAQKDYFISLALEKRFAVKKLYPKLLFFTELKTGYLFGNFRGLDKSPEGKFVLSPIGGIAIATDEIFHFKLGYQYLKPLSETIPPHHIYISILFL